MNLLSKRFLGLRNKFKKVKRVFGGFSRAPFLYIGIISVILFGLVSLGSEFILKSPSNQGDFAFGAAVSKIFTKSQDQFLFSRPEMKKLESPDLTLIQENSLLGISPPTIFSPQVLGSLIGGSDETEKEIIEHIVQSGDNLGEIAENFGISLNTLLWANDLSKNSIIQPGQKLVILPVSGVIHHVRSGDTLSKIAEIYKGKVADIIALNELSDEGDIFVEDILIIPNGEMPPPPPSKKYAPSLVPIAKSYFICPIALPCNITQGLHWYNAIDFGHGKCNEPIYAVAGGEIQKTGYDSKYGTYIRILHPNGVITVYAHLSRISVSLGENVSQGQIIGYMGYTGRTIPSGPSGCHLHFEVRGAKNPFAR